MIPNDLNYNFPIPIENLTHGKCSDECCWEIYEDIKLLDMAKYGPNLATPWGICVLIVFNNGEYDVIARRESCHYRYNEDGIISPYNSWLECDDTQYDALINKYSTPQ